ncbi:MAG TPA: MgtC/SapB family protein [Vicinamibacterales bacterium]|jgi:uncharacterized membrane protein YhiD involved in acid resistance
MTRRLAAALALTFAFAAAPHPIHALAQNSVLERPQQQTAAQMDESKSKKGDVEPPPSVRDEIVMSCIRVPIAAALGTILALRPRRRGTPPRQPAVIQTQIILAIVGAVVMMVVGTSIARAFGIVGAAGLVRYRAKIEDPKDAGVMLTTLAVGLAAGVGLFAMAVASTVFILITLGIIESFEPDTRRLFDLAIRMGKNTDARRDRFESILRRHHVDFELRAASDEEVTYEVFVPLDLRRDRISNALLGLDSEGHGAVDWTEKKLKAK